MVDGDIDSIPDVSIHAPERGATSILTIPQARYIRFNPRSRTGSDVASSDI